MDNWFIVQTTDRQLRNVERAIVMQCNTMFSAMFRKDTPMPPHTLRELDGLKVHPVSVSAQVWDELFKLMRRPTRIKDANRTVPPALRPGTTLRHWRDILDEFGFVSAGDDDGEDDEMGAATGKPPPRKKARHNPYEARFYALGVAFGAWIKGTHPDAEAFGDGRMFDLDFALLSPGLGSQTTMLDLPEEYKTSAAVRELTDEQPCARWLLDIPVDEPPSDPGERALVDGICATFPGSRLVLCRGTFKEQTLVYCWPLGSETAPYALNGHPGGARGTDTCRYMYLTYDNPPAPTKGKKKR